MLFNDGSMTKFLELYTGKKITTTVTKEIESIDGLQFLDPEVVNKI